MVEIGKGRFYRNFSNSKKLWLTDKLHICAATNHSLNQGLIGNELLNKIFRNNLKKLSINSDYTFLNELQILCKPPFLIEVDLYTFVKNEIDEPIPIEEIMILFPNLKKFQISPSYYTMESFNKLSESKFSKKFQRISLRMIKTEFDPTSLCIFLEMNFDENADFTLTFQSVHLKNQLLPRVIEIIDTLKTIKLKNFFHY